MDLPIIVFLSGHKGSEFMLEHFRQFLRTLQTVYSPRAGLTRLDLWDWSRLQTEIPFLTVLTTAESERLSERVNEFLERKTLVGIGMELKDWQCQWIATYACLPILNLGIAEYRDWQTILVYPDTFVPDQEWLDDDGILHRAEIPHAGQAWDRGPIILSWNDIVQDGAIIVHEMVHTLDAANGEANGFPRLHRDMHAAQWSADFTAAFTDLCRQVEHGEEPMIDPYATTDPAEFFAVICEYFFFEPEYLHEVMPTLYDHLRAYFRQDPRLRAQAIPSAEFSSALPSD